MAPITTTTEVARPPDDAFTHVTDPTSHQRSPRSSVWRRPVITAARTISRSSVRARQEEAPAADRDVRDASALALEDDTIGNRL